MQKRFVRALTLALAALFCFGATAAVAQDDMEQRMQSLEERQGILATEFERLRSLFVLPKMQITRAPTAWARRPPRFTGANAACRWAATVRPGCRSLTISRTSGITCGSSYTPATSSPTICC